MKHKIITIAFAMLCMTIAGCKPQANGSANSPGSAGGVKRLAFVTNNASDYWTIARKGTEKADAELDDVSVEFKIPSDGTAAEQTRILNDLTSNGVAGIAISPVDPANEVQLINDTAKKALVITQDSDAATSDRALYIGTDNKAAGRQAGELIKEALPDGGKIMVFVGKLDAQNAKDRFDGIKEVIAGTKIEIVDVRTDDTDLARAKSNVADAMIKTPDLAGLVGLWAYNGPAILNAVKDANKVGKIKIICFDEDDQTLAGIKDGQEPRREEDDEFEGFGTDSAPSLDSDSDADDDSLDDDVISLGVSSEEEESDGDNASLNGESGNQELSVSPEEDDGSGDEAG